jgi:hypothetical protein
VRRRGARPSVGPARRAGTVRIVHNGQLLGQPLATLPSTATTASLDPNGNLTDDGVRLYVDGRLIIDQWRDQSSTAYDSVTELEAGNHLGFGALSSTNGPEHGPRRVAIGPGDARRLTASSAIRTPQDHLR